MTYVAHSKMGVNKNISKIRYKVSDMAGVELKRFDNRILASTYARKVDGVVSQVVNKEEADVVETEVSEVKASKGKSSKK